MKRNMKSIIRSGLMALTCICLFSLQTVWAGNISDTDKYAWNENVSWQNWHSTYAQVTVEATYLAGYTWAENAGWIKLGSTPSDGSYDNTTSDNWGVNRDGSGNLSGYAWSENVGWINFNPTHGGGVTIDPDTGNFSGYVWSENVGWIELAGTAQDSTTYKVKTDPATFTVTFDKQSGTGGSTSVSATYGSAMPSATAPTRSGYTFGGYYTQTGGSGTQYYTSGMASSRNWDLAANTTLYAKWTVNLPTKVALAGPSSVNVGATSSVFTLTSQDADGNAADVDQDTAFHLTSNTSGTARFYSDVTGKIPITQVTITSGTQTIPFYYRDSAAGTPTVTTTRTSGMALGSATHDITINGKPATRVNLTGPATATAGAVSTAFTLTSLDADGNDADVTADTKFDLASNSSGTKAFYSNAAGTSVINQVTIPNGTSTATFYYKDGNAGTPTITAAWSSGGTDLGSDTFQPTVSLAATTLATSTSVASSFTHFEVTVAGIRMGHNGANWVTIFSGAPPAKLDLVNGGTFPGISNISLPVGTYNQVEVTFKNSLPVTGKLTYGSKTYYTTAATFGGASNIADDPSNDPGSQTVFTFRISDWGALNANVAQTFDITPITVDELTDYQPTLIFTISNKFLLKGIAGTPQTYYFSLSEPGVALAP